MHHRMLKLINLSFVSHTEDCIKIRDFTEDDKVTPSSAKLPSSKDKTFLSVHPATEQPTHRKVQDFLATGSFSPVKSPVKKKSIVNFPKLPEMKANMLQMSLKKAHSIQRDQDIERSSRSPNRRPDSSRKYVRVSVPDQNPFKVYKS